MRGSQFIRDQVRFGLQRKRAAARRRERVVIHRDVDGDLARWEAKWQQMIAEGRVMSDAEWANERSTTRINCPLNDLI